ncbi:hypothetical protein OG206_11375 [Streptomyces sp. NBC_01341]|uniref:hypothetical protein n=1 Tax=Streptomyces sp. NBC_01341 TaxID=2903831 RepID=UPI002E10CCF4|nr:hypothetical protein OG206_11375 [Streptomyces sp. NBC_01341]
MDEETEDPEAPAAPALCANCGTSADGGTPPATWLCSVENGRRRYFCEACARTHIRAVEGRLDSDLW